MDPQIPIEITPEPAKAVAVPKRKFPIFAFIFGTFFILALAMVVGFVYYKVKIAPTSTPTPAPSTSPSLEPSPSTTESPSPTPKSTRKPASISSASPLATTTPYTPPSFDVRFGNPSANVKQTLDEGKGEGRIVNREYTSIDAGQFDEVASSYSPRVTVCFHIVSNEVIPGSDLKFSFSLDDQIQVEDTLSNYDKLEAGRLYDWCHDVTTSIGKHTAKLLINPSKSIKESNYVNDLGRVDWENLADKIAPNFTLVGPTNEGVAGTCLSAAYIADNVSPISALKIEQKLDGGDWATTTTGKYCFVGTSGATHTYGLRITDQRGNANTQSSTFQLF